MKLTPDSTIRTPELVADQTVRTFERGSVFRGFLVITAFDHPGAPSAAERARLACVHMSVFEDDAKRSAAGLRLTMAELDETIAALEVARRELLDRVS